MLTGTGGCRCWHSVYPSLLDDLVGTGEERSRHSEAERVGGLEIDDQLEFARLLDRQISRLGTLQDSPRVTAGLTKGIRDPHTIADQAAGLCDLAPHIVRWNGMARCQRHELVASTEEERIAADE